MRMYTLADKAVSPEEFSRAVTVRRRKKIIMLNISITRFVVLILNQEFFSLVSKYFQVCTGRHLSKHLVQTVFQIFDDDGDNLLSYKEFVAMMKDRVNRGLKSYSRQEGWTGFKRCVKQEVSAASSK